jgi:hypothetical protein
VSHRTRSLALALFKHKLMKDITSHYFHTPHQFNATALHKTSSLKTLLGLFPTTKWRWWWCLSLFRAYSPNQQKQRGCSHVFLIWPMNSLLIPNFGFLLANTHSFSRNDLQFNLFTRTAHSIFTSSPPNIQSMSTVKQDTVDSRWVDQSKTPSTYNRIQQQWGGRTVFLNNTGTQNSNICPMF